jgi:hypothetical protein
MGFRETRQHNTRHTWIILLAMLPTACASRAALDAPLPEIYYYDYEFAGTIEGRFISGTIRFMEHDMYPVEYMVVSDDGLCRSRIHRVNEPRIHLRCGALAMEFVRAGKVVDRATASVRGTREVSRRECSNWAVDPTTRQRTCTAWRTVTSTEAVTHRGYVEIRRVGASD